MKVVSVYFPLINIILLSSYKFTVNVNGQLYRLVNQY